MTDMCPVAVQSTHLKGAQPNTIAEASMFLLKQKKLCDVIFSFEKPSNQIEAHRLILRARSPVFDSMFRGRGSIGETVAIKIDDSTPERFQDFLEFLYADKFEADFSGALELLHLAHKYQVEPLLTKCKEKLLTGLKSPDALQVFQTANKLGNLDDLRQRAGDIMQRWGRMRLEGCKEDELKSTLAQVIKLFRYICMTCKEFATVVVPTKLLSSEESVEMICCISGDSTAREKVEARGYSVLPRKRNQGIIGFFGDEEPKIKGCFDQTGNGPLNECLSFYLTVFEPEPDDQNDTEEICDRKLAITSIIFQWPARSQSPVSSSAVSLKCNFSVHVMRFKDDVISDANVDRKFQTTSYDCSPGEITEILVLPPMELVHNMGYCIAIKEEFVQNPCVEYQYSWPTGRQELKASIFLESADFMIELKSLQRNGSLSQFPSDIYNSVQTIRGIRIGQI